MKITDIDADLGLVLCASEERKAEATTVLDVRGKCSFADFFVICSGRSNRQVTAIAEHVIWFTRKKGLKPLGVEGLSEGQWVLIDYGSVVMHVFYEPVRGFYDLEGLWVDAKRIELEK